MKYTQEQFDAMPVVDGYKQCPTGDYSNIKQFNVKCSFAEGCSFPESCIFAEGCSFAKLCSFAKGCRFAEGCTINKMVMTGFKMRQMSGLGENQRTLLVWSTEKGIYCQAGCFFGAREEFENAVTKKYSSDHKYIRAVKFLIED